MAAGQRAAAAVAQVVVPLGADGGMRVAATESGPVSLDVAGYVAAGDDRAVHPLVPRSLLGTALRLDKGEASDGERPGTGGGADGAPRRSSCSSPVLTQHRTRSGALWPRGATAPRTADLIVPRKDSRETAGGRAAGPGR